MDAALLRRRSAPRDDLSVVTHDDIRRIALSLPETFEQASYGGRPSWRTKQRMFTWLPDMEPEVLVVWVDSEEEKQALIAADPRKFSTTAHYDGHPIVLVDLQAVDDEEAAELITESWRLRAPKKLVKEWDAAHP